MTSIPMRAQGSGIATSDVGYTRTSVFRWSVVLVKVGRYLVTIFALVIVGLVYRFIGPNVRLVVLAALTLLSTVFAAWVLDKAYRSGAGGPRTLALEGPWVALLVLTWASVTFGIPLDVRPYVWPEAAALGAFDPVAVTRHDRWPHALDSPTQFDLASRAEILAFAAALPEELAQTEPGSASANEWVRRTRPLVLRNFAAASRSCAAGDLLCPPRPIDTWGDLVAFSRPALQGLPSSFAAWRDEAQQFHAAYARHQWLLARGFTKITSEVLPLDPTEILGDDFPDKSFLVTLDDGPSSAGGPTDHMLSVLRENKKTALFFLVGVNLDARVRKSSEGEVRSLYAGMCVGSHGMEHLRHSEWTGAAASLAPAKEQLGRVTPSGAPVKFFRPPFGDRSPAIVSRLRDIGLREVLWNIDSDDWQPSVSSSNAAGRALTLMLLWRRGVLLFHDAYPKASDALPVLWQKLEGSGALFMDCHSLDS